MKKADEKERIRNQMEYIVAGYNMLNDLNFADGRKIKNELGWYPKTKFEDGIVKTIDWYLENPEWLK